MISVIIPLYNKEPFIEETIRSVLTQSYNSFELIIVNDGSTDNSLALVKSFKDDRIKLFSIDHSGVSRARNFGVEKSNGEWIAFLDADDWWAPDFLFELNKSIKENSGRSIFAAGTSRVRNGEVHRYQNEYLPADNDMGDINFYQIISKYLSPLNSSNAILKKKLFIDMGSFNVRQKKHEDHDLWMRLCLREKVFYVNKSLSFYRNTTSYSASKAYYEPYDFIEYLKTLEMVRAKLSTVETKYFQKYCNKFVVLTFIKYYKNYSRNEERLVLSQARKLLKVHYFWALKILKLIPNKNAYSFLKMFRNK